MKKLLAVVLALVLVLSFAACGKDKGAEGDKPAESGAPAASDNGGNTDASGSGNAASGSSEIIQGNTDEVIDVNDIFG